MNEPAYIAGQARRETCNVSRRAKTIRERLATLPCRIPNRSQSLDKGYAVQEMRRLNPIDVFRWPFDGLRGPHGRLIPRWIFLRALALIYFSAFYSLLFQINGLIGPEGVLPAQQFLKAVAENLGGSRYWYAPTLYWYSASSTALITVTWIGLAASLLAFLNLWPRLNFLISFACFLSFISASGVFSSYQSDGMLLEAGFLSLFFTPRGLLPGWGANNPPSRASWFLLQWEWFRIYFESGMVKLLSGDVEWRNFTAMDEYYQNGPLPTWIGWYAQHLPHWFHAASVGATLGLELGLVFMMFFPRRVRLICFFIVTPWEIGVILTANYTFLNYLVLSLGFLLLDDSCLMRLVPARWQPHEERFRSPEPAPELKEEQPLSILRANEVGLASADGPAVAESEAHEVVSLRERWLEKIRSVLQVASLGLAALMLSWIFYDTTAEMIGLPLHRIPVPVSPIAALEPFRIANQYGLFAVMTRGRYEIEFQGSDDGRNWTPYLFRNKPQLLNEAPRIYAPYQPRFDWNLWFASLGPWRQNEMVPLTEEHLLLGSPAVLSLFRDNPFPQMPPRYLRAVLWQYWFTSADEKRRTENWWRRRYLGLYAPELTMTASGEFAVVEWPAELTPRE
ncbi:MAG: lipase maturation factor family protein [Terracidiphilus sp.]